MLVIWTFFGRTWKQNTSFELIIFMAMLHIPRLESYIRDRYFPLKQKMNLYAYLTS